MTPSARSGVSPGVVEPRHFRVLWENERKPGDLGRFDCDVVEERRRPGHSRLRGGRSDEQRDEEHDEGQGETLGKRAHDSRG